VLSLNHAHAIERTPYTCSSTEKIKMLGAFLTPISKTREFPGCDRLKWGFNATKWRRNGVHKKWRQIITVLLRMYKYVSIKEHIYVLLLNKRLETVAVEIFQRRKFYCKVLFYIWGFYHFRFSIVYPCLWF